MPGTKVKELYLARSVKDLQKIAIIPNTISNWLVKSAQMLFVKAGEEQDNGDEEKAYVLYTKYFEIARYIKASKEYIKDKVYYDSMISSKQLKAAMGDLEALEKSLEARYQSKIDESEKLRKNLEMMKIANDDECTICYEPRNPAYMFYPCGHATFCKNCASRLFEESEKKCPDCRRPIKDIVRVFQ